MTQILHLYTYIYVYICVFATSIFERFHIWRCWSPAPWNWSLCSALSNSMSYCFIFPNSTSAKCTGAGPLNACESSVLRSVSSEVSCLPLQLNHCPARQRRCGSRFSFVVWSASACSSLLFSYGGKSLNSRGIKRTYLQNCTIMYTRIDVWGFLGPVK